MLPLSRHGWAYAGVLAGALAISLAASWTPLGTHIDNYVYDWIFNIYRPPVWQTQSILLTVDELSLNTFGGRVGLRRALANGLQQIAAANPKVVALDNILADHEDAASDDRLEAALRATHNLILPCDLLPDGSGWENPLPRFKRWAVAVGHVHADLDADGVGRALPLAKAAGHDRRWALALEAFRVSRGAVITESLHDLQVGEIIVPASSRESRLMRIRYLPRNMQPIPAISLKQLHDQPALANQFTGKIVFAGVTAQTYVKDRWLTPYSSIPKAGVEIHANAFETMAQQRFLTSTPSWLVIAFATVLVACAGVTFAWRWGWTANVLAAVIITTAFVAPYVMFTRGKVLPFSPGVASAWLAVVAAALWQQFFVRKRLVKSEAERDRYQHAMHFVTHEMRTPLTAIQGSSELMSRYAMSEEKRQQIAQLIHSESKRLGRMIEMFLNVERLSAGEMDFRKEKFSARDLMTGCVERARPLAERKHIRISLEELPPDTMLGDRELMEYAFYNLLTNAIKYSPSKTEVTVFGAREGERLQISVRDQGIGMDQKEVRKIFQKFYRTKRAEQSGEVGTGIGLSIVEQIIEQHGGKIEVESAPGRGSCFTLILPAALHVSPRPIAAS